MILGLLFGFVGGIAIGSFFHISIWAFAALALFALLLFMYRYLVEGESQKLVTLCAVFLVGFLCGFARVSISNLYATSQLTQFQDKKVSVEGVIADEPDVREDGTKYTVELSSVSLVGVATNVHEKVLVSSSIYPPYEYGDKVKMTLTLELPKAIESDDGRVFDYSGYLRARGIWYTAGFTQLKLISHGNGNPIVAILFNIKHAFTNALENALPQPESSLIGGLLLGAKQSLGKELLSEFQRTGTSHVVVLSGYNIAIVAESIMALLVFLPQTFSFGIGLVSIVAFTVLSGGGASAWRAAIMVLVALFAKKLNRTYKASRAFGFAVILMLAPNPLLLMFDPSFQLSVLATIGLIFVSPYVAPYMTKITERFGAREIVSSTVATQITVLPFLIYNTGILSTVSLPVNILILGTIPITMLFGFLTGMFGLVSLWLSFIPALPAYILLWYQLTVVHLGSITPFGVINLPAFSPLILFGVYAIILTSLYFVNKKQHVV